MRVDAEPDDDIGETNLRVKAVEPGSLDRRADRSGKGKDSALSPLAESLLICVPPSSRERNRRLPVKWLTTAKRWKTCIASVLMS